MEDCEECGRQCGPSEILYHMKSNQMLCPLCYRKQGNRLPKRGEEENIPEIDDSDDEF